MTTYLDPSISRSVLASGDARLLCTSTISAPVVRILPSRARGISVILVFAMHNCWNCWQFLNATGDADAAKELLAVGQDKIGILNSLGLIVTNVAMPIAMLSSRRRTMLWFGVLLNLASPVLRYWAAMNYNFPIEAASYAGTGLAYGFIAVFPPLLATAFFPEERWSLVISITVLSNQLGGMLASLATPVISQGSGEKLLGLYRLQMLVCFGLAVFTLNWLKLPDLTGLQVDSLPLKEEFRACLLGPVHALLWIYGVMFGLGVILQSLNPVMLKEIGYTEEQAGDMNCCYQLGAFVIGLCLSTWVTNRRKLRLVLHWLYLMGLLSSAGVALLCWWVKAHGNGPGAVAGMYVLMWFEGVSIMGLPPFLFQEAVYAARPASENFVTGAITFIGCVISPLFCQFSFMISGVRAAFLIFLLTLLDVLGYTWLGMFHAPDLSLEFQASATITSTPNTSILVLPPARGATSSILKTRIDEHPVGDDNTPTY